MFSFFKFDYVLHSPPQSACSLGHPGRMTSSAARKAQTPGILPDCCSVALYPKLFCSYTVLENRTAVDLELTAMRKENVLRTFRLGTGREDWGVMSTEHYRRVVSTAVALFAWSNGEAQRRCCLELSAIRQCPQQMAISMMPSTPGVFHKPVTFVFSACGVSQTVLHPPPPLLPSYSEPPPNHP